MFRKNIFTCALIGMLAVVLAAPVGVFAQTDSNTQGVQGQGAPQVFSKAQLDQMLAPIALYPDSLLAQVLLASTYPSQVVEADRWVKAHRGWSKARINAALDNKNWDLSVKALVPFPKVLAMMDRQLSWTTNLGEAFLAQQEEVMAQVQELRQKAYDAGNLQTTPQQKVVVARHDIEIEPANPEVIYVPYYDPWQVYGNWWWPGYPPFVFYPYAEPYITYGVFGFAAGIGVGPYWNWGWGHWGWHHRHLFVNVDRFANINGRHPGFNHRNFRTARFHSFARYQVPGLGRVPGVFRHGHFNRPSAAEVRRGFSGHRNGGFAAHSRGAFSHGAGAGTHPGVGTISRAFGYTNHGFAAHNHGRAAHGFAGHGHSGGFAAHSRGSFSHGAGAGTHPGVGAISRAFGYTNHGFSGGFHGPAAGGFRGIHSGGFGAHGGGSFSHGGGGGAHPGVGAISRAFGYPGHR